MFPEIFVGKEFDLGAGEAKPFWRRYQNMKKDWRRRRGEEEKRPDLKFRKFRKFKNELSGIKIQFKTSLVSY